MVLGMLKRALIKSPILRFSAAFASAIRRKGQALAKSEHKDKTLKRTAGGGNMSQVVMLRGAEPREILQTVIEEKVPAITSYLSKGKWHVAKVLLTDLGANRLNVQLSPRKKPHPINIQLDQPVGVSLKYGYGKFIFETKVVGLEPSPDPAGGGTIILAVPDRIQIVQRRSYFRVDVPSSLKVNVLLWHRRYSTEEHKSEKEALAELPLSDADPDVTQNGAASSNAKKASGTQARTADNSRLPTSRYWQGKLVDISAGGGQIVVDAAQGPDFKKGQFIGMRFTPMPYETPLMFDAQIRNILPTADAKSICLGLQIVGLEASPEGRQVLQRLCNVVEQYYKINQSSAKQRDFQTTNLVAKPSS